ncbi:MAG: UDP-2,4-diacetamido-2,4,6-trideoxy-beta-L-altropyranose hydrolase [Candidatus Sulfotelmatobacter sp.]
MRADASVAMGTGHVMRCLALAQAWQDAGGECTFAMAETTPALARRLKNEGMEIENLAVAGGSLEDAQKTGSIALKKNAAWIVADGYHFGADYQKAIRQSKIPLLFIDDNAHADRYDADVVLNQNAHANESLYTVKEAHTRLLLGPRYVMLRREFTEWREWKRKVREAASRILIVAGGSDPENITRQVIEALDGVAESELELVAVVGGSNPHLAEIEEAAARSRHSCRLVRDAANMPDLMAWADLAISAAGSICWEFCALGLPAFLIPVASNQNAAAESLQTLGAAKVFSWGGQFRREELSREVVALLASISERESLSQRTQALVDTEGASRVVAALSAQSAARRREL